jgi:hypothetical protein
MLMVKKRDYHGIVHLAKRPLSVFSSCSTDRPTRLEEFAIALVDNVVPDDAVITCLMCIGGPLGRCEG